MSTTLVPFTQYADDIMYHRYSHVVQGRRETWEDIAHRVVYNVMLHNDLLNILPQDILSDMCNIIVERKFIPGGRILSQAGRLYHQTDNCYCLQAENTREGWADLAHKCTLMSMSGGGVGVDYSGLSPYGTPLKRSGGIASGPVPCIQMIDAILNSSRQGGERRGAGYASLKWDHADIQQFIQMKTNNVSLQHTNISVRFDKHWQSDLKSECYPGVPSTKSGVAYQVFLDTLKHACQYGDPGFQFDADSQVLRNACTEIITADDGDSCCIGSINLAKIKDLEELREVTQLATLFLLCNTLYTDFPTEQTRIVKEKNRRLGLGLMGVAEWFIQRQLPYGYIKSYLKDGYDDNGLFPESFANWLQTYAEASNYAAVMYAQQLSVATPIATRAIAPTGTISTAIGHTTPGIEPVFHTAYQRTYNTLKSKEHSDGYIKVNVIDPIVQKWMEQGYDVKDIDTAWSLSQSTEGIERRLKFQAFVQRYVDNGISSTVNLPPYVEGIEDKIAPVLLKYLPQLRGVTFYPDGRHENQPVVPIDINKVINNSNSIQEVYETCKNGECGV